MTKRGACSGVILFLLAASFGCQRQGGGVAQSPPRPRVKAFLNMPAVDGDGVPPRLSETGAFTDVPSLAPADGLVEYNLNFPFWSDGAEKRRWAALPVDSRIHFSATEEWRFPPGTVFVKHFERDGRRLETRLLVCDERGEVYGYSYRWRDDQSDADLVRSGRRESFGHATWYFPGPEDCRKCHLKAAGFVLGVNAQQLNGEGPTGENQLLAWGRRGLFDSPPCEEEVRHVARLCRPDEEADPEAKARSYLDANCGYCHRPGGAAADFDARFATPLEKQALVDAPARINFGIDRARQIAPNDPWRSIVLARVETPEPTRMPPLAHEVVDRRGADILRDWITHLQGPPVVTPPTLTPKGNDFDKPVEVTLSHPDHEAVIRYTLDGSPPGEKSPVYEKALRLTGSTTVRARAFRPGHTPSIVVYDTYVVDH